MSKNKAATIYFSPKIFDKYIRQQFFPLFSVATKRISNNPSTNRYLMTILLHNQHHPFTLFAPGIQLIHPLCIEFRSH